MKASKTLAALTPMAAAGALVVGLADPASALAIRLSDDTGASFTVQDDGVGDDLATNGFIQYNSTGGSIFADWGAIVAEGSACVVDCPRVNAQLNAQSIVDDAFLTLEVTETDLTLFPELWLGQHSLSGVADGSVTIEAFWDAGNGAFAKTNSIGGPYTFDNQPGFEAFSADLFDTENGSNPFSMTTVITFNHPNAEQISQASSSASFSAVPVPAALPLLGAAMGLLGIAGFRRRG